MRIFLDNVNTSSSSGPNSFGKKLKQKFEEKGHAVESYPSQQDVQLSFIVTSKKCAPTALRLDGIYFNTRQDWQQMNTPLKSSFDSSDVVIYQSNFNKILTEKFFGSSKKSVVINNGTCLNTIKEIQPLRIPILNNFSEVWCCASSWRPHKRLKDNISYFLQMAPKDACLIVAGENPDHSIKHPNVFYAGQLSWEQCISLYKRAKVFIHLAFLDHCPNVVVDARAAGCNIIVSSSGGTKEVAGTNAIIVDDIEWDMMPLDLYEPPPLNFDNFKNNDIDNCIDINVISEKYLAVLQEIQEMK
jgi:glycosyltransferase involved in cell wall biosynthesis